MLSAGLLGSVPSRECRDAVESSAFFECFLPQSRICGRLLSRTWGNLSPLAGMSELLVKHKPKNKHVREIHTGEKFAHLEDGRRARETAFLSVLVPRWLASLISQITLPRPPHLTSLPCVLAPSSTDLKKGLKGIRNNDAKSAVPVHRCVTLKQKSVKISHD